MSILKQPINYLGLEDELEMALKADTKYKLENDAKLRAIEQNVPTYEHFRQMVNGAHLRPLARKDTDEITTVSWNLLTYNDKNEDKQSPSMKHTSSVTKSTKQTPEIVYRSVQKFHEEWETIDGIEDKMNFLLQTRDLLPEIFQIEIPTNILSEFLDVCLHALTMMTDQYASLTQVIDILTLLTTCNRFQLTITFMTIHDKSVCHQLFHTMFSRAEIYSIETSIIIELCKKFQVEL